MFQHSNSNLFLTADLATYESISQWLPVNQAGLSVAVQTCYACASSLVYKTEFIFIPSMLIFEFSISNYLNIDSSFIIKKDNVNHIYTLKGIIYYGHSHFTSQIITQDKQIWYHNGISLGHSMIYEGLLDTHLQPNLFYSKDNHKATCAIYIKI